jgi:replicative DNA helicase
VKDEADRAAAGTLSADARKGTELQSQAVNIFRPYMLEDARRDALAAGEGVSTGIAELDDVDFRFNPGQLYVVAGRPGEGKTGLMLDMLMRNVERRADGGIDRRPSVFITYEVSARDLYLRAVLRDYGRAIGYSPELLRSAARRWLRTGTTGNPTRDADLNDAAERIDAYMRRGLLVLVDGDQEGNEAPAILRQLELSARTTGRTPALVVLDYFQKVKPDPDLRGLSRQVQLQDVADRLRRYAKGESQDEGRPIKPELAVPVLVGAQVNREAAGDDSQPELHHVREADDLANDAVGVLTLKLRAGEGGGTLTVKVVKNRDGSGGCKFDLAFHGWCGCFAPGFGVALREGEVAIPAKERRNR